MERQEEKGTGAVRTSREKSHADALLMRNALKGTDEVGPLKVLQAHRVRISTGQPRRSIVR